MPSRPDVNGYLNPHGSLPFNVRCAGGFMFNRLTASDLKELRFEVIEWVWVVEQRREMTRKEIVKLCAGCQDEKI